MSPSTSEKGGFSMPAERSVVKSSPRGENSLGQAGQGFPQSGDFYPELHESLSPEEKNRSLGEMFNY
jgi:hypothetical protein